jgi:hypothetical protein
MSAPESVINITIGDAVLGLIVIFCLAAIWAASGKPPQHGNGKKD